MKVVLTQLSAVVAGSDSDHSGPTGALDACAECLFNSRTIQTVYDDFENRVDTVRKLARNISAATQSRAVRVVGGRHELFVMLRTDLAAGPHNASGKRQHHSS